MCTFISFVANNYRTDDEAILRSFVICRPAVTLQRMPTIALISSFREKERDAER